MCVLSSVKDGNKLSRRVIGAVTLNQNNKVIGCKKLWSRGELSMHSHLRSSETDDLS